MRDRVTPPQVLLIANAAGAALQSWRLPLLPSRPERHPWAMHERTNLVIDPACTVVFEAIPAAPGQMRRPPRPPGAPLLSAASWRRALGQGGALSVAALSLCRWPGLGTAGQRSLVFALLLLAGGGLVWLNGEPRQRGTRLGAALGLAIWLLLQLIPGLPSLLQLAPLDRQATGLLLLSLLLLALLAAGAQRLGERRRAAA